MSKPRKIVKGATYLITRRCFQRQFLLRPSELINHIVLYCLAYAAQKAGMLVHAYCVLLSMSTAMEGWLVTLFEGVAG